MENRMKKLLYCLLKEQIIEEIQEEKRKFILHLCANYLHINPNLLTEHIIIEEDENFFYVKTVMKNANTLITPIDKQYYKLRCWIEKYAKYWNTY